MPDIAIVSGVAIVMAADAGTGISLCVCAWVVVAFAIATDIFLIFCEVSMLSNDDKKFLVSKVVNALISLASVFVAYFCGNGAIGG